MRPVIHHGDCIAIMQKLIDEGAQFDSACTDPPYHLISIVERFGSEAAAPAQGEAFARQTAGFMGQEWDGRDEDGRCIAFEAATWRLVYQLLKPGAILVAFGHPKTKHRMVCAIEDAGFEIRDEIAWVFSSGFPKGRNVSADIDKIHGEERPVVGLARSGPAMRMAGENSRDWHDRQAQANGQWERTGPASPEAQQWDDWRTELKPAWEGICVARKPLDQSSVARNVLVHGTGAMNIGACRIDYADPADAEETSRKTRAAAASPNARRNFVWKDLGGERASDYDPRGRWPANLIHDGSAEVLAQFPTTAPARKGKPRAGKAGEGWAMTRTGTEYDDAGGSAARFFYQAKADASDRVNRCRICSARSIRSEPACHPGEDGQPQVIRHPTVKPQDLMRWLVRLVTPPGGRILDPFAGTGSTGIAADREGFSSVLIEQSAAYVGDIEYRLAELSGDNTPLFSAVAK